MSDTRKRILDVSKVERGGLVPYFITSSIFLMGLLFWLIFVFSTVTMRCVPPSEVWLAHTTVSSIFTGVAVVFFLILVWNSVSYLGQFKIGNMTCGRTAHYWLNMAALVGIGFTLYRFDAWVTTYDKTVVEQQSWNATAHALSDNSCYAAKPYLGRWRIVEFHGEYPLLKSADEIEFTRDFRLVLSTGDSAGLVVGRWWSPMDSLWWSSPLRIHLGPPQERWLESTELSPELVKLISWEESLPDASVDSLTLERVSSE